MPSILEAARHFNSVPDEIRRSPAPIVTRVHSQVIRHPLGSDYYARMDAIRATSSSIVCAGQWSSAEQVSHAAFASVLAETQSLLQMCADEAEEHFRGSRLDDHHALLRAIHRGRFPELMISDQVTPVEVRLRAARRGYSLMAPSLTDLQRDSTSISYDAARNVVTARLIQSVVHLTSQFVVPHDTEACFPSTASLLDQLWIVRASGGTNEIRLIAVVFSFQGSTPSPQETLIYEDLRRKGYEIFRINGWWSLIDPIRTLHELLRASELNIPERLKKAFPGLTIRDYLCDSCGRPMIRDAFGYGIVEHRNFLVHEQCFDRFVDEGQSDIL